MEGIIYAAARELYDLRDGVEVTLLGTADDATADHDVRDVVKRISALLCL